MTRGTVLYVRPMWTILRPTRVTLGRSRTGITPTNHPQHPPR